MQGFIKKNSIIIFSAVLGISAGIYLYSKQPVRYTYIVIYEYPLTDNIQLPDVFFADTLFKFENLIIRNFKSSYSDTLKKDGIKRGELKVFSENELSEKARKALIHKVSKTEMVTNNRISVISQKKRYLTILIYALIGLFSGALISFVLNLITLRPKKTDNTTPIEE